MKMMMDDDDEEEEEEEDGRKEEGRRMQQDKQKLTTQCGEKRKTTRQKSNHQPDGTCFAIRLVGLTVHRLVVCSVLVGFTIEVPSRGLIPSAFSSQVREVVEDELLDGNGGTILRPPKTHGG